MMLVRLPLLLLFSSSLFLLSSSNLVAHLGFDSSAEEIDTGYCFPELPTPELVGSNINRVTGGCRLGAGCLDSSGNADSFLNLKNLLISGSSDRQQTEGGKEPVTGTQFSIAFWNQMHEYVPWDTSCGANCVVSRTFFNRPESLGFFYAESTKVLDYYAPLLYAYYGGIGGAYEDMFDLCDDGIAGWRGDEWGHVVLTWNGEAQRMRLYINKVEVVEDVSVATFDERQSNDLLFLSNRENGMDGMLDELYIFDHELTQSEINLLYDVGTGAQTLNRPSFNDITASVNQTDTQDDLPLFDVPASQSISLSLTLADGSVSGYSWSVENTQFCEPSFSIAGGQTSTPSLTAGTELGTYLVTVCSHGAYHAATQHAYLRITALAPSITSQPDALIELDIGENHVFTVSSLAVPEPSFQWQYLPANATLQSRSSDESFRTRADPLGRRVHRRRLMMIDPHRRGGGNGTINGTINNDTGASQWVDFEGATESTFIYQADRADDGIRIRVVVTNAANSVASNGTQVRVSNVQFSPPDDGGGNGDSNAMGAIAGGTASGAVAITALVLCCCCVALCLVLCFCAVALGLAVFSTTRQDSALMKLPKPDYRQIAYGKLLTPQHTGSVVDRAALESDLTSLEQLIVERDGLANALIQSCKDPSEMERLATALLHIMDHNGLAYDLMSRQIAIEADVASDEGTLFRANTAASRLFTKYSRVVGVRYLWESFAVLVYKLDQGARDADERRRQKEEAGSGSDSKADSSKGTSGLITFDMFEDMELDTYRMDNGGEEGEDAGDSVINIMQLQLTAQRILKIIISRRSALPPVIAALLTEVHEAVSARDDFSDLAVYRAMGGFLFLRYLNPALTAPQSVGLAEGSLHPQAQRSLLLITKVMQNLANNTLPGKKEEYMTPLNSFVTDNVARLEKFYRAITSAGRSLPTPHIADEPQVRENCLISVLLYLVNTKKLYDNPPEEYEEEWEQLRELAQAASF